MVLIKTFLEIKDDIVSYNLIDESRMNDCLRNIINCRIVSELIDLYEDR